MAKVKKFSFFLPLMVMLAGKAAHKGDLHIEGIATDQGNQPDEDPRFVTDLTRILFNGADILPVIEWLEHQADVDLISLHAAIDAHVAKLFTKACETAEA